VIRDDRPPLSLRADLLALGLLAVLVFLLFFDVLAGDQAFYYEDYTRYYLPLRARVSERLLEGALPAWNPDLWLGSPLLANPVPATFYPGTLLLFGADLTWRLDVTLVLHLYALGAFTYLLARERVGSGPYAFAAAAAASLGGIALSYLSSPSFFFPYAYTPLVLYAALRTFESPWGAIGLGAAVGVQALAGDLQAPVTSGLMLVALFAAKVLLAPRGERLRSLGRHGVRFGLAGAIAFGLAAVQLLPSMAVLPHTERALRLSEFDRSFFHFHPARLASFALPFAFGTPLPDGSFWGESVDGTFRFWFYSVYFGATLLPFVAAAVPLGRRDPAVLGLSLGALLLLLCAMGRHTPLHAALESILPGLDRFRFPEKLLAPLGVLLPVLGAAGLRRVGGGEGRGVAISTALVLALAGAVLFAASSALPDALADGVPAGWIAERAAERISFEAMALFGFAAVLLLLLLGWRKPALRRAFPFAVAAAVLVDLIAAGEPLRWRIPRAQHDEVPALATVLHAEQGAVRLLRDPRLTPGRLPQFADPRGWPAFHRAQRAGLVPNTGMLFGVQSVVGDGAFAPAAVQTLIRSAEGRLLALGEAVAATHYLVPMRGADAEVQASVREGRLRVVAAFPQAEAMLLRAAQPPSRMRSDAGTARLTFESPEELRAEVEAPRDTRLVLADTHFPGWRAEVDGAAVPIEAAQGAFRSVAVPAGKHEVVFRYEVPGLFAGALLSGATLLGILGACGVLFWRRRRVG
jgi:hypothetical protein